MYKPFAPPNPEDSRSPCPALNALANHSYLPHNGMNITVSQLVHATQEVYKLSTPMAWALALAGMLLCGKGMHLNLQDLAIHGRIEHDGSLVHENTPTGQKYASCTVDVNLLDKLLSLSSGGKYLTLSELAEFRMERSESLAKPLDGLHARIAKGELALLFGSFRDCEGKVLVEHLRTWLGEEKLPENWDGPIETLGFIWTNMMVKKVDGEVVRQSQH